MKYIVSVDIGISGAMSLIREDKEHVECVPIPTIGILVGKKKRNQYDISSINYIFKSWISAHSIVSGGAEVLKPFQSSTKVAFSMGAGAMLFESLFAFYNITFIKINPRTWQQDVFKNLGIQYNKSTTKQASIQAAKRLFPNVSLKRTERSRTDCDGMSDSLCIGAWILKNNI